MKSISVADSFVVRVSGEENSSSLANIIEELHYDVVDDSVKLPTVGNIMYDSYLSFPLGAIELRKGILYEYNDYLIIYDKNNLLRIHADKTQFEILVSDRANKQILFYTVEILIRYYAPLYGLTFLHAGGFIMDGKTNVICAFGGVGKTEVTLYALEKGAKFLADDFAIINSNGDVFPYMKKIFLCDFPYTDTMLHKVGKRKWLFNIKQRCEQGKSKILGRIASWLESNYLEAYIDYTLIQKVETARRFYHIDHFYWVDSGMDTCRCEISSQQFIDKMTLCLDLESRRYFDYDGYLRFKYPFLNQHKALQYSLISKVATTLSIEGVMVKGRHFDDLSQLIISLNNQ